ncbi:hypothetical protein MBBAR_1c02210 [Methanobrevibacter arboriphilus JCM 13429 = DSM 1125]|uniref:Uncharacterized protein n=2 Tax=Methanobrevibacter arboriphilus TaxID=39441 RepID=A0A1V6N563_METAZ|nr:hypothetical protein MBBAR_1c02210 [Methanobrevibacter arboriphilus JCM 13429 = DSM 1125]
MVIKMTLKKKIENNLSILKRVNNEYKRCETCKSDNEDIKVLVMLPTEPTIFNILYYNYLSCNINIFQLFRGGFL